MKIKIEQAVERLEEELVSDSLTVRGGVGLTNTQESNGEASEEAVTKAKDAVAKGKAAIHEAS
jgi:tubulin-specific chaperone A